MAPYGFQQTEKNNFDLLRLLFAGTVCLVHAYQLSGNEQLSWIADFFSSAIAVKAFFVISGFLIFSSHERSSSLFSYFEKRIRRIYPAYFTVILLCAIGLFFVSQEKIGSYFSLGWIKYVVANLAFLNFLQPSLPGVFLENRLSAVNGSLWTLKLEVMFYVAVPAFVYVFRKFGRLPILVVSYILSVAYSQYFEMLAAANNSGMYAELGRQLPGQLCYFLAGATIYYHLDVFKRYIQYFIIGSVSILIINMKMSLPWIEPAALATVVIFFGLFLYSGDFGKHGDFSYGVYILHFPIIQLVVSFGWLSNSPLLFLLAVVTAPVIGAIAMWHIVEKRFLLRRNHYVATALSSA